jgi:hypothetical protein
MATAVEWLHKESNELIIKFLDNEIDMIIFIELYHNNYCKAKEMEKQQKGYSEEEASELVYNIIGEYAKHYGIMIDGCLILKRI